MNHLDNRPSRLPPDDDSVSVPFLRLVLDFLRYVPGAFDHERACPYCLADADDPREARLLRLDLPRLGFGDGVVLLCPGCGFEEEARG